MKLPYRNRAFVPPEKIVNYLLSQTHNRGKYKAAFFKRFGFDETNNDLFKKALLKIAHFNDVTSVRDILKNGIYYGKSYEVAGTIGDRGRIATIKTVWKILKNKRKPSLVTVAPM